MKLACAIITLLLTLESRAQSPPVINSQPVPASTPSQGAAQFSVTASGSGPLTYRWRFNGAGLASDLQNGVISTLAGNGAAGFGGDGGAATAAALNQPSGVARDATGNIYITDTYDHRVRRVDTNGIIATVAGNGGQGYSGDGVAATAASLNFPVLTRLDAAGNLLFADHDNHRIRRVGTNGIITTIAGNGTPGFSGDGGPATNAQLHGPYSMLPDPAGNLFIVDSGNNRIRKVGTNGIIVTVAGGGAVGYGGDGGPAANAVFNQPSDIALDAAGNLYISDLVNNRVRKVGTNGIITTIAGNGTANYSGDGGAATNAALNGPYGLALDADGNLYISDFYNGAIRMTTAAGTISTVVGNGVPGFSGDGSAAASAQIYKPCGLCLTPDGATLLFVDGANQRVRKVFQPMSSTYTIQNAVAANAGNYDVVVSNPYGSVTSSVAALTILSAPSILVQPQGQFAAVGAQVSLAVTVSGTGPLSYQWSRNSQPLSDGPGIAGSASNTLVLLSAALADTGNYQVLVSNAYGNVLSAPASLTVGLPPLISSPPTNAGLLAGGNTSFSITASGAGLLSYQWRLNGTNIPSGVITTVAGTVSAGFSGDGGPATSASLYEPQGVAADGAGNVFIGDTFNQRVRRVGTNGVITTIAGGAAQGYSGDGAAATNAALSQPCLLRVDAQGDILFADNSNHRIRKVDTNGIITTVAGIGSQGFSGDGGLATSAQLNNPIGLALDASGNLFIADAGNNRIRKVNAGGFITTVAGNGTAGYSGDGGSAINASFRQPSDVALDGLGNLFVSDLINNRIRKVDTGGIVTTFAGLGVAGYTGDGGPAVGATLNGPYGMAFDANGSLYVAEFYNGVIRRVDPFGIISTVAGNGILGFSGDGGPATNAQLYKPSGLSLGPNGTYLYTADLINNRIRRVFLPTAAVLPLDNVVGSNAGNYDVIVSNPFGSVTSAVAALTVLLPPEITNQPSAAVVEIGATAVFAAGVAGTAPLTYQWYASTSQNTAAAVPQIVNGFLIHASITNGGQGYTNAPAVQILGGGGNGAAASSAISNGMVVAVNILSAGSGYTNPPVLQFAPPPVSALPGQNNSSLVLGGVGAGDAGEYQLVVSNAYGAATSSLASLSVLLSPEITGQPLSQSCLVGGSAAMSVTAVGAGPLSYQWYALVAQDLAKAVPEVLDDFVVGATVTSGGFGYSNAPQVLVLGGGGSGAAGTATVSNGAVVAVTMTSAGFGYTSLPFIQIAPPAFSLLAGQTNPVLSFNPANGGETGSYIVVVTNAYGAATSSVAWLQVGLPRLQAVVGGQNSLQLSFAGTAGNSYVLQSTTNLNPPANWQPVFTNTADINGNWNFTDTNTRAFPALFYRISSP